MHSAGKWQKCEFSAHSQLTPDFGKSGQYFCVKIVMMKESKKFGQLILSGKDVHASGIPSGYYIIDQKLNGWQQGDLIILASRPSVGKSLFAKNLARNAAMKNVPVLYFSLEIQSKELCSQILQMELEESDISHERYSEIPLFVDDTYPANVNELCFNAKKAIRKYGVKMVIIDYLQLLQGPKKYRGLRASEVEYIVMALKGLAKEMEIPVIALSQVTRPIKQVIEEPTCKDLRASSSIESVADVIMFLHREGESNSLIIAKNRHDNAAGYRFTELKKKGMLITE